MVLQTGYWLTLKREYVCGKSTKLYHLKHVTRLIVVYPVVS